MNQPIKSQITFLLKDGTTLEESAVKSTYQLWLLGDCSDLEEVARRGWGNLTDERRQELAECYDDMRDALMSEKSPEVEDSKAVCPRCANSFECTADLNCWCIALPRQIVQGAAEGTCFCPDCMVHAE